MSIPIDWRNDLEGYGMVAIILHWSTALLVFTLFPLGLYMTELTYYDPLYATLPAIHKSVGVILFLLVMIRIAWRRISPPPPPVKTYLLLLALPLSGYLSATATGGLLRSSKANIWRIPRGRSTSLSQLGSCHWLRYT